MIDLHLHLDGSLNPKNMPHMADMAGITLPTTKEDEIRRLMMVEPDCTSLGEYLEKFELPLKVLQTAECIEYAVYELLRDLHGEGLLYAEIRYAPQLHMHNGLSQQEVVEASVNGLIRGIKDFNIPAQLILCCMRGDSNREENLETVRVAKKYLGVGVCAVDLAGNEAAYPTENFEDVFGLARKLDIPITIHAGEAAGSDSVRKAISMGATRIGHGIHAVEDEQLLDMLSENNISLEMCYTSNLQTCTVGAEDEYPIRKFLEMDIPVTLNTDNMTVSGTNLSREYRLIRSKLKLSDDEVKKLLRNSVEAAFLPEVTKKILRERVNMELERL